MDLVPDISQFPCPREDDLMLFRVGETDAIRVTTVDLLEGPAAPVPLCDDEDAGRLQVIDDRNNILQSVTFPAAGGNGVRSKGEGIYEYDFSADRAGVWACLYRFRVGKGENTWVVRKEHVVRATSYRYIFLIPQLRELLDKSRKRSRTVSRSGKELRFGYSNAALSVYLDIGLGLINATPPNTSFTVENFPNDSSAVAMLIYSAFIVGMNAQGAYSLDTDVNFQFSGNALNVDHLSKIGQVLALPGFADFKERLKEWKQMFRPRGVALIQMQTSFSLGRLVAAVPGQLTRFGFGIGASSFQPLG